MLKKYPRIDSIIQKAGAEIGAWLFAAGSFIILVWFVKVVSEWLNLAV